jgi:sulfopyruvate decarboxylase TPP-binding subunit
MSAVESVAASAIHRELKACGFTHAVTVPDTLQRHLLDAVRADAEMPLVTAATENEAVALAAGLWIGGREPVLIIQHAGLLACVNYLRGVGLDGGVPLVLLVGLFGRESDREPAESSSSMVRLAQPVLNALQIPWRLLDGPANLGHVRWAREDALAERRPAAALIGAEVAPG